LASSASGGLAARLRLAARFDVERLEFERLLVLLLRVVLFFRSANFLLLGHPPIGALGLAPQKTRVPIIPMMCTSTMLSTIDFAVAVPTPTGPPDAV
jgi:hypothetical protein